MKKKVLNENESIISTMFTEKELAELKFTPEEIEALENAELISQAADFMPNSEKDMDAFFEKYDKTFPPSDDMFGTFKKFVELQKTDPDFPYRGCSAESGSAAHVNTYHRRIYPAATP